MAKLANHAAKKNPIFGGVCDFMDADIVRWCMDRIDVGEVWGVGRATQAKVKAVGIHTVAQLRDMPSELARKLGTVVLERTVAELQGVRCMEIEDVEPQRKGIAVTRSSGTPMTDIDTLKAALTAHATRAAHKLRDHGLVASHVSVFFHTNPHNPTPKSSVSRSAAERGYRGPRAGDGFAYTKAGVILEDLVGEDLAPKDLFAEELVKEGKLSAALDAVNDRFGKKTVVVAAEGIRRKHETKFDHRTPRYTTRIDELPVAIA